MFLNKAIEMGKLQIKTNFIYRLRFMSSILISPLILGLFYFVWASVFQNSGQQSIQGYTFPEMITYYVVSMVIGHFIFSMVGNKLQEKVIYGDLTQHLLKPMPVLSQLFSEDLGDRAFALVAEVIPVFFIAFILFHLKITSVFAIGTFLLAITLAFLINFMLGFLTGMLSFWIQKIESIQWLLFIFIRFLSGEFIPLEFLGTSLFQFSRFLPFYYLRYGPIQVFLGKFSLAETLTFIGIQVTWIILLFVLYRMLWGIALRRFGAVGG